MESLDEIEATLKGQANVWKQVLALVDFMALKCAVELRLPDIIHSYSGGHVTLAQIASRIPSPSPGTTYLARIMRVLVRNNIFSAHCHQPKGGHESHKTLYSLTPSSRLLLQGPESELTLAPLVLLIHHPLLMSPWQYLADYVRGGGSAFENTLGRKVWDSTSKNPEFNRLFNDGMACSNKFLIRAVLEGYKQGFKNIGSLVDVGGGTGGALADIVRSYPHIKGINFDQPHVVATAPACHGVTFVGGDMFDTIPHADAVLINRVLHNWSDEDCVKILRNCRKAIPEKNGKVIIVDIMLKPEGDGMFDEIGLMFDLLMMVHTVGGKERSELEWKKILAAGGFPRYNIIKTPSMWSIIEAYPQ